MQSEKTCIIIGGSHAGINCAFALRKEGWVGKIIVFDSDPELPYHRPPLSKTFLTGTDEIEKYALKSRDSYEKERITLQLGVVVESIDPERQVILLKNGKEETYDKLVLATGARPLIPEISGIQHAANLFPLRTAGDVKNIKQALSTKQHQRVVVIGAGYIGLEIAASIRKLGHTVTILELEKRILSRVTSPEMSQFFHELHRTNGVEIETGKEVTKIENHEMPHQVTCADGSSYEADLVILGVGIKINSELAKAAGLEVKNGICVDATTKTSHDHIYAIGDCTWHRNPHYNNQYIRLESVQNAVDQAKVAAATICGKPTSYDTIPWFWSDQYDVKLQIVGLASGYDQLLIRRELNESTKFSIWYFKKDQLLAVDAINNPKAYVIGTKFIKERQVVNKERLVDPNTALKPTFLI
ncbi:MAG: FAD/NAD(P)-binding oxidoreductase [Bacteroidota bacterium]